jgi:glycolate oxidase
MMKDQPRVDRLDGAPRERPKNLEKVVKRLREIVGERHLATDPETLYIYSQCMGNDAELLPDVIVMPSGTDEVQAIVRLCNEEKVGLAPFIAGSNQAVLSHLHKRGIIMDLKRMNKILKVDEKNWYALVEPGVTFGQLKAYLEKNHPGFIYAYPYDPPSTSVMAGALSPGTSNLSHRHGTMSEWINAMEMILPTGEILRTGAASITPHWLRHSPFSELAGLFIAWQGSAGICTKIAVQLWPRRAFEEKRFILTYGFPDAYAIMRECALSKEFDDVAMVSSLLMKGALAGPVRNRLELSPGEPAAYVIIVFSGADRAELRIKGRVLKKILRRHSRRGVEMIDAADLRTINPGFVSIVDLPSRMEFALDQGRGGIARLDTLGPGQNWEKATEPGLSICEKQGFKPLVISRAVKGMHSAALSFIIPFNRGSASERERLSACMDELTRVLLDLGFIPSRASKDSLRAVIERADPEWINLMEKIRSALDPNRIMNPRRDDDA